MSPAADGPFVGTVALVTGAARPRGIGRATALRLAAGGADVACLDIARPYDEAPAHATATSDDLDDVVAEIQALGRQAVGVRADIADGDQVEAAVAEASDALGTITAVANVAGGSGPGFGLGPLVAFPDGDATRARRQRGRHVAGVAACAIRMVAAGSPGASATCRAKPASAPSRCSGRTARPRLG